MSKYGVISGPYFPVLGPEITPYLDTFHVVSMSHIINENFSSLTRLIRVTSWVKRYVNNLKAKAINETDFEKRQFLTADELKESERLRIKDKQKVLANSNKFELLIKKLNIKPGNNIYLFTVVMAD